MDKISATRRMILQTAAFATPAFAATSVRASEQEPNITINGTSKAPHKPISNKICVLYNSDGRIVHVHREVTLLGGQIFTDAEIEARARKLAMAQGHDTDALSALRIAGNDYERSAVYRVDVATKELVKQDGVTNAVIG
jgi:hypothetical protein